MIEDLPGEIWKEIKDFEGRFWISNCGRLKSHDLRKNTIKIVAGYIDSCGYYQATLRNKPLKRKVRVHTLVAENFLESSCLDEKLVVNHIDGNKLNNNVSNLERVTLKENCAHAVATGLHDLKGSKHPNSKLTEKDVREIRTLYPVFTQKEIAEKFGICRRQVGDIINRVNWAHVV